MVLALAAPITPQTLPQTAQDETAPKVVNVEIVHGPVVESVTDTTAIIAWSTNVNAGTLLHYGTDVNHLDQIASMPWGGLTHRVNLKDLKPDTKYYFRAESAQGQGSGSTAVAPQSFFRTKAPVKCVSACA
jgi:phosphodiesterase/alkaline phosphatase D-like protein